MIIYHTRRHEPLVRETVIKGVSINRYYQSSWILMIKFSRPWVHLKETLFDWLENSTTMPISAEEQQWAQKIKDEVAELNDIAVISDFEYLHHAIVSKGNVKKALKRMKGLEAFRKQYELNIIKEDEPMKLLKDCNDMFPGFIGSIGVDNKGRAVQYCDLKSFDPKLLKTENEWRIMMGAFYYLFQAMNADVDAIRSGIIFACNCKGIGWKNFSFEAEKRAADFYQDAYPIRMKHIYMINPPLIVSLSVYLLLPNLFWPTIQMNAMIDIVKVFLSKKIWGIIQTEKSDTFFASGKLPVEVIPATEGGSSSEKASFEWLEKQISVRTKNEKEFKLWNIPKRSVLN